MHYFRIKTLYFFLRRGHSHAIGHVMTTPLGRGHPPPYSKILDPPLTAVTNALRQ